MAGKSNTRQKMINMMYLVFIAMLALNIGKEVLATIGVINEDLENSTSQFKSNSEGIYKKFDVLGVSEPAWAEALPTINKLKNYSFLHLMNLRHYKILQDVYYFSYWNFFLYFRMILTLETFYRL